MSICLCLENLNKTKKDRVFPILLQYPMRDIEYYEILKICVNIDFLEQVVPQVGIFC